MWTFHKNDWTPFFDRKEMPSGEATLRKRKGNTKWITFLGKSVSDYGIKEGQEISEREVCCFLLLTRKIVVI